MAFLSCLSWITFPFQREFMWFCFSFFQISCEEAYLNGVLGDLTKRRSQIASIQQQQDLQFISALTPVSEMVGYTTTLRTLTSGMASFSMELSHYESLTPEKQAEVIEQISGFS